MSKEKETWYGATPSNWKRQKLKYSIKVKNGKEVLTEVDNINNTINVYGSGGVFKWTDKQLYKGESVLFGRKGTIGKPIFVNEAFWTVDTMYYTHFTKESYPKYFYYLMCVFPWNLITTQTALPSVVGSDIENFDCSIPQYRTQKIIANYLDVKTSQIDSLVTAKENLILLLEEKRQSLITEVVTKGLNPNVQMKDSDVEWIGEIPKHWDITKIKYTTYVKGRIGWQGLTSDEFIDEGPYLVTGTDFKAGMVNWISCYHISEERYNEAPPIQLREDDLLITKDGTIGKLAIVRNMPNKAILNSGIFVTRPLKDKYLTKYMYWLLNSTVFDKYIKYMETGSTIKHLYQETFVNFEYPLPDIKEQNIIVKYLDREIDLVDSVKENLINQIQKLKEYRRSLIYEAVTGKIDVREFETVQ
ncbi:restriction endonuclease subunit S [Priestia megaterium]|uniref:restriction endonuclease subunit S n=1 Tax=Priestia megaterium TaxID=1404 RepID=UPI00301CF43B